MRKIYIENSASNQGYFAANTEFRGMLGDLIISLRDELMSPEIFFISDSIRPYEGTASDFLNDMSTAVLAERQGYPLDRMFRMLVEHLDSGEVAFFISDCILSYPDADISDNREINKDSTGLRLGIRNSFSGLQKQNISASVYAFISDFRGTYYNYQNGRSNNYDGPRPYYLWILAEPELLQRANNSLAKNSTFTPKEELHFGSEVKTINSFTVNPVIERGGTWSVAKKEIKNVEAGDQICMLLDLTDLPNYAQEIEYLNENLKVECNGCEAKVEFKEKLSAYSDQLKSDSQRDDYVKSSHIAFLGVENVLTSYSQIRLMLPYQKPLWYLDWSCDDDLIPSNCENRTYFLTHLINGVLSAYDQNGRNFIDINIQLKR